MALTGKEGRLGRSFKGCCSTAPQPGLFQDPGKRESLNLHQRNLPVEDRLLQAAIGAGGGVTRGAGHL